MGIKYSVLQDYRTGYNQIEGIILVWCITRLAQNQMLLLGMTFCITSFVIIISYIKQLCDMAIKKTQKTYYNWNSYKCYGKKKHRKLWEILFVLIIM